MPVGAKLFILIIIALVFIPFLIKEKIRKDKKLDRPFYNFGDYSLLMITALASVVLVIVISNITEVPRFSDPHEQVSYGKLRNRPGLVEDAYQSLLEKEPDNINYHFELVSAHFQGKMYGYNDDEYIPYRSDNSIHNFYHEKTKSDNIRTADLGHLMLGVKEYKLEQYNAAYKHLQKVQDTTIKYFNWLMGELHLPTHRQEAEEYYRAEIANRGHLQGAYDQLALVYYSDEKDEALAKLVNDPQGNIFVSWQFRQIVSLREGDLKNYFRLEFENLFRTANLVGAAGAFLIMLVWFLFLVKIDFQSKKKWLSMILTLLLGAALALPVTVLLSDVNREFLGFHMNGNPFTDFLYCVVNIGLVEELVKFLPFFIMLRFSKAITQPIDYIVYASLSALGFAFTENLLYIRSSALDIVHTRAFWSTISHMFDSSLIAYGLVLAKFKKQKSSTLYFFMFWGLAGLAHGFYDFWVLSESVNSLWIITLVFTLCTILIFSSIINNALNNSHIENTNIQLNTTKLASLIATALIGIILFEYVCLSFIYGPRTGWLSFVDALFNSSYVIFFLALRLSNIDIVRKEWAPVEYFEIVPYYVVTGRKLNQNQVVGKKFTITPFRQKSILTGVLPIKGEIIKREKISGDNGWFLLKLDSPVTLGRQKHDHVLIRAKDTGTLLENDLGIIVHFMIIPSVELLNESSKKKSDFQFVDWAVVN